MNNNGMKLLKAFAAVLPEHKRMILSIAVILAKVLLFVHIM